MIAHDITTNMTDSVGKLIALGGGRDWMRVAVRWGSGFTSHLSVYQWQTGKWGGYWRHVFVRQGHASAPLKAVSDRSYGQLDRRSELEVYFHSQAGPGISALGTWLGREYVHLRAEHEAMTEASKAITLAPGRSSYTEEQQARFKALRFDRNLSTHVSNLAGGGARLEAFGLFLRKLGHGGESLIQEHACEVGTHISTADADDLCYIAVELGLAAPTEYAGPSDAKVTQDGQLSGAAQLAWNKHGRGPWGKNEPVVGARFWRFGRGRRYSELPDYT